MACHDGPNWRWPTFLVQRLGDIGCESGLVEDLPTLLGGPRRPSRHDCGERTHGEPQHQGPHPQRAAPSAIQTSGGAVATELGNPSEQGHWTLCWQEPSGGSRKQGGHGGWDDYQGQDSGQNSRTALDPWVLAAWPWCWWGSLPGSYLDKEEVLGRVKRRLPES